MTGSENDPLQRLSKPAGKTQADGDHGGGLTGAHAAAPAATAAATAEAMDRMHEAGIKAFPARTAGKGNQVLKPRVEEGVTIYELAVKR
jgi:hypothetical protein